MSSVDGGPSHLADSQANLTYHPAHGYRATGSVPILIDAVEDSRFISTTRMVHRDL